MGVVQSKKVRWLLCAAWTFGETGRTLSGLATPPLPILLPCMRSPSQAALCGKGTRHNSFSSLRGALWFPGGVKIHSSEPITSSQKTRGSSHLWYDKAFCSPWSCALFPDANTCGPMACSAPHPKLWICVATELQLTSSVLVVMCSESPS